MPTGRVLAKQLRTPREDLPRSVTLAYFEALRICFKISVGNGDFSRKTVGPLWFRAHCPLPSGPNISVSIFSEGGASKPGTAAATPKGLLS